MLTRKHLATLAVMIVLTVLFLSLPTRTAQGIKAAVSNVFLPLFGIATTSREAGEQALELAVPRRRLLQEHQELQAQKERLEVELLLMDELRRENARLHALLGWRSRVPWKLKPARVLLRDPANWWRAVQIDVGSRDGVKPNSPVLTSEGLVGRVAAVGFDHSQVVLLGDPDCPVSALVENEGRHAGVIGVSPAPDSSIVEMSYLPRDARLAAGDRVVTSGLGGLFPKGIPVGRILDARPVEYGLHLTARLRLHVNLSALEEVWVVIL